MKVLVTGGAGYIGSFVTKMLQEDGHEVLVVDNLVYGHSRSVTAALQSGDIGDPAFVDRVFSSFEPEAVMHLAAWIEVGESVKNPAKYFANNTGATACLLQAMATHGVENLVFSSTAAVYGTPETLPITESTPMKPDSPYGHSKLLSELSFPWYAGPNGLRAISLRYFNAAGAAIDGSAGEDHEPATHLITNAIKAALGQREFTLFGNDYDTPDGTCIRDYIHVLDIAQAHVTALAHLAAGGEGGAYNVGTGRGTSNLEILDTVKRVSGVDFPVTIGPRRAGDPNVLVADATLLSRTFGWEATYSDLETIVETSWKWQSSNPTGYRSEPVPA